VQTAITYEIRLPYFKQGDDLSHYIDAADSLSDALKAHSEMLQSSASTLRDLATTVQGKDVSIDACTHFISLYTEDEELISILNSADYARKECL
jgi:hypothetical protein